MTSLHPGHTGLYIHIPFCKAKCNYCGFYSEPISAYDPYRLCNAIVAELRRYRDAHVQTAYIGGGSPTILPDGLLVGLVAEVRSMWPSILEFTVECNPGQVCGRLFERLRSAGVNRISVGAQSFDQGELELLGRHHRVEQTYQAVRLARAAGFGNIGLDLIFAIPGSDLELWRRSLDAAIALDVEHISVYALSIEPGTVFAKAVEAGQIRPVEEELDRQMYDLAIEVLEAAGYRQYEVSNLARCGFECRHNMGYWVNDPYVGVGPAAASYWQGWRRSNVADIDQYIDAIESGSDPACECELITDIQAAWQTAVLNLRMRDGIDLQSFKDRTGYDGLELFAPVIDRYVGLGLMEVEGGRVRLTRQAMAIADSIVSDFVLVQSR